MHPGAELSLPLGHVAVAVVRPVLDELSETSRPRRGPRGRDCLFQCPLEADAVELIFTPLCERTSLVGFTLIVHPRPKLPFLLGNVFVAVLRSILEQLLEARVPFLITFA